MILLAALKHQTDDESQLLFKIYYVVALHILHDIVHDVQVDELTLLSTRDEVLDDVGDLAGGQRVIVLGEVADLLCSIPIEIVERVEHV